MAAVPALRAARIQAGFASVEAAARRVGYSPATLRTYEAERVPTRASLRTVERLLRVYALHGSTITLNDVFVLPTGASGALGRARTRQTRPRNRATGESNSPRKTGACLAAAAAAAAKTNERPG